MELGRPCLEGKTCKSWLYGHVSQVQVVWPYKCTVLHCIAPPHLEAARSEGANRYGARQRPKRSTRRRRASIWTMLASRSSVARLASLRISHSFSAAAAAEPAADSQAQLQDRWDNNHAALLCAVEDLRYAPRSLPQSIAPDHVRVKMRAVGICGSDVHLLATVRRWQRGETDPRYTSQSMPDAHCCRVVLLTG